ncbi:AAA family ATPase [Pantanalinema rosaneae CENA516]|uniref:AAA family ATPase n=1 Tax=Pantanalinema rosaneae TaxID=1620701 RepID=UPI003D6F2DE6
MIPQRLILKNFLSYQEASLDFQGLHTACICGSNGAGKSSLLEAIAWAVWGESRAVSEDDVIHTGAAEAQVDFIFTIHQRTYRILRSRQRGQTTTLEFQIAIEPDNAPLPSEPSVQPPSPTKPLTNFRSLTAKGVRATQQLILEHLKLDFETFVNSAYLRQGRADEFMLKRPSERKQILADLLKLSHYDELAERAKDQSRQFKGQVDLLEQQLEAIQTQLWQREAIATEQANLELTLAEMQQQQTADTQQLQTLQATQHQYHTWQQQLSWQQQQHRMLEQDSRRLQQELVTAQQQQQELEQLLQQEQTIVAGYAHWQRLQAQEEQLATRFKTYQLVQAQRQQYQEQHSEQVAEVERQLQQIDAHLEALTQQDQEIQQILQRSLEVEAALQQLHQARVQLQQLDQLQTQVAPLSQRRQHLQSQLDRAHTRLLARLEELHTSAKQLRAQQEHQPQLQQAIVQVSDRIAALEQQRLYQQKVRDRGLERRDFMERLQVHQRNYEIQLAEVEQKIQLLKQEVEVEEPVADLAIVAEVESGNQESETLSYRHWQAAESQAADYPLRSSYPPCPLCDRPLDEHHWHLVMEKHQQQKQEILNQIWVIREQLSASEREIQILRQEYRDLEHELAGYGAVLERRGQLQEQLQMTASLQATLLQVMAETAKLEQTLQSGQYAQELQEEIQLLDRHLAQLNYDEKTHALVRGDVDRWRWAEIKQAEIKQAQRRQAQLAQRRPELIAQLTQLEVQLEQYQQDATATLASFDQQLTTIGYDLEQHNALRLALREAQSWQLHYQELHQAGQKYPQVRQRVEELTQLLHDRQQNQQAIQTQIAALVQYLQQVPDLKSQIQELEQKIQQQRGQLDTHLAYLGRLQQQQQQLALLSTQHSALSTQLQTAQRQYRIYQELAQAFGKNGIQALMIENILPQLEAETNRILNRLSGNQLHVQFITQRSHRRDQSRSAKAKGFQAKLIETLDILIADPQGTRPYETYSGGEAFRVNFAIRLALSRLLAQRSGTALQMLIIDEGFGTQDAEGCDRLIAAITAIAPDFACILTVTHVPHFKEAFQTRIEVIKTETGSQLSLSH